MYLMYVPALAMNIRDTLFGLHYTYTLKQIQGERKKSKELTTY